MNLLGNRNYQFLQVILVAAIFTEIPAQENKTQLFMGRVVSNNDKSPVSYALVVNSASKNSTFSDTLGYFSLPVREGDTLVISRIGYYPEEIRISRELLRLRTIHLIGMNQRSYDLNAVAIKSLGTYEQFRYNVIHAQPEEALKINPQVTRALSNKVVVLEPQARIPLGSPVTALYNLLSKEGKSLRKLEKEEARQREADSYKEKYSPEVVSRLTGLRELELEKFMKYCPLQVSYIQNANEYEIAAKILECYGRYKSEQDSVPGR
jgi:hypothetical protein